MAFLRAEFPAPAQPKTIARQTRSSHEAVKKWLRRNEGAHVVQQTGGGWYRARADVALLRRLGLDPLKVHSIQAVLSPKRGSPPPLGRLRDMAMQKAGRVIEGQRGGHTDFMGRLVTVQPRNVSQTLVSIRASKDPFTVHEFCQLASWLEAHAGIGGNVTMTGWDLNVDGDDHILRVRGAQSVALGEFTNALVKVYNKQAIAATRFETCHHRVDLDISEAARILNEIATPPITAHWREPDPLGPEVY